jgi:hypothetical protein
LALFYFNHRTYTKTATRAAQVVAYLQREGEYAPKVEQVDYLTRKSNGRDDLRHTQLTYFPSWANNDPTAFFNASQTYERVNGRWATALQLALPRELSLPQHIALADDFVQTILKDHPSLYVLHEPTSKVDGLSQPHIHVLFSERTIDGISRTDAEFFRRYNPQHPERGGAKKDPFFTQRRAVDRLRDAYADLTNYHLERAGHDARIDPRSLKERGISREASTQTNTNRTFETSPVRQTDQEHLQAVQWWERRKEKQGYDFFYPNFPLQIAQSMRAGSPGKQLSADQLLESTTKRLESLRSYRTELVEEAHTLSQRLHPESPLRPTEERRIDNLISKGTTVGLPAGEREVIHRGAQLGKQKGKDHGYDI